MDRIYVKNKIKKMLVKKGVSDQKVSEDLGRGKNYIHNILAGRKVPDLEELFEICNYFEISVCEFFCEGESSHVMLRKLYDYACQLSSDDLKLVIEFAKEKCISN